ncbi:hypothetical protein EVAR_33871_1 [Eumeta japonica]|uniref:Uncharacterized protein n=1 Tax=Eumeta variegata TaxID=151549 RepID=A0A4C1X479_EUMVA|nr:hypothetical protein EVAR_33871_1 [Eumeta japonica]
MREERKIRKRGTGEGGGRERKNKVKGKRKTRLRESKVPNSPSAISHAGHASRKNCSAEVRAPRAGAPIIRFVSSVVNNIA